MKRTSAKPKARPKAKATKPAKYAIFVDEPSREQPILMSRRHYPQGEARAKALALRKSLAGMEDIDGRVLIISVVKQDYPTKA